jgi:hypothetical protein
MKGQAMARFLGLLRMTPDEAAKTVREGLPTRRRYFEHIVAEAGGTVEGMWLTNVGDWDLVLLLDMPGETPAEGAAATLARKASGATAEERWIELVDVDDVAAVLTRMAGQSSN